MQLLSRSITRFKIISVYNPYYYSSIQELTYLLFDREKSNDLHLALYSMEKYPYFAHRKIILKTIEHSCENHINNDYLVILFNRIDVFILTSQIHKLLLFSIALLDKRSIKLL